MTIHVHRCADVSYHCYYLALRDAFPLFHVGLLTFLRSSERDWFLGSAKKPNTSLLNIIPSLNLTLNIAKDFQTAMAQFLRSLVCHFLQD